MADGYVNPGFAVANQLQDILTQKRMDARQAMLDQLAAQNADLNKRNVESEIATRVGAEEDRKARAQAYAFEMKERAQNMQIQDDQRRLQGLGDTPAPIDQATAQMLQRVAPNRVQTMGGQTLPSTQTGGFSTLPGPDTSGNPPVQGMAPIQQVAPVGIPTSYQYLGSPQYQQRQETSRQLQGLAQDPRFANNPDLKTILDIASKFPQTDPNAVIERLLTAKTQQPAGHIFSLDEATNTLKDLGTKAANDVVERIPRPPREPLDKGTFVGPAKDEKGNEIPGQGIVYKDGVFKVAPYPIGVASIGSKTPQKPAPYKSQFNQSGLNKLATLQKAATPRPGFFGGETTPNAGDVAAYKRERDGMISNYNTTPEVKEAVKSALNDPATKGYFVNELIDHIKQDYAKQNGKELSGQEVSALEDLFTALR